MSETTKSKSVKKPDDFKPADVEMVKIEHSGVRYEVRKNAMGNLRFLDLLERNQLTSALRMLIGDGKFGEFLDANDDGSGFVDPEYAGEILELIGEAAGTKN